MKDGIEENFEEFEEELEFKCPECGKVCSTEGSLRGHRLKKHGISPMTGKPATQKPKIKKEVASLEKAEEEKVVLPSLGDYFSEVLKLAGVGDQQIQQILIKATEINLEDLYQITALLKEFGLSRDRIRTVVNLWSTKQHIPIPPDLKHELGILVTPQPFIYDRAYQPYQTYYQQEYQVPQQVRRVESETYSLSNVLIAMLQSQNNLIGQLLQQKNDKSEDSEKTLLLQKLEKMEQEQQKLKEELKQKELEKLENAIYSLHQKIEEMEKTPPIEGYKTDEFRLVAEGISRLAKAIEENKPIKEVKDFLHELVKAPPEEIPEGLRKKVEEVSSGVVNMLQQIDGGEYVAEQ